jgi:flap endonuclease GEN
VEEAEAQCALLNLASLCVSTTTVSPSQPYECLLCAVYAVQDGCFTSDSDSFLFGARTVYRDVFIGIAVWSGY